MPDTAAQPKLTRAEAARLNGARSRGPRTPEGKARSAGNALKHGLTAQSFALLPGEDAEAYAQLLDGLTRRYRPADELAAHLVQRLASVMWRQQRADRLEAEVLSQLEQRPDSAYLGGYLPSSPHTWDAARFSAVQRQQARLDRAFFRLLDELDRLTPAADESEVVWQIEPKSETAATSEPAKDDAKCRNEPKGPPSPALAERAAVERLLAEGRVKPVDDYLRTLLAQGGAGPGAPHTAAGRPGWPGYHGQATNPR